MPHPIFGGAISYLEKNIRARYVSAAAVKHSVDVIAEKLAQTDEGITEEIEQEALENLKVQLKRSLGVLRYLGYDTMEEHIADRLGIREAQHLIVGAEETGLHLHGDFEKPFYEILKRFVERQRPTSILYIHEDLNVEKRKEQFENANKENKLPEDIVFDFAKREGIPVEFGAFGWADRSEHEGRRIYNRYLEEPSMDYLGAFTEEDIQELRKMFQDLDLSFE